MKLIQIIKQRLCRHTHNPDVTRCPAPFRGYTFQCPKCSGYVAYFKHWDDFVNISEKKYQLYIEEGAKLHEVFVWSDVRLTTEGEANEENV